MDDLKIVDLATAGVVELTVDDTGKVWVNVDGKCRLRVGRAGTVRADGGHPDMEPVRPVVLWP